MEVTGQSCQKSVTATPPHRDTIASLELGICARTPNILSFLILTSSIDDNNSGISDRSVDITPLAYEVP